MHKKGVKNLYFPGSFLNKEALPQNGPVLNSPQEQTSRELQSFCLTTKQHCNTIHPVFFSRKPLKKNADSI